MKIVGHQNVLFVKNFGVMSRFYTEVLGFHVDESSAQYEDWLPLQLEQMRLALHAIPPVYAADIVITDPPQARADMPFKPVFLVADLRLAVLDLQAVGVPRLKGDAGTDVDAVDFLDPEGNVFQIAKADVD